MGCDQARISLNEADNKESRKNQYEVHDQVKASTLKSNKNLPGNGKQNIATSNLKQVQQLKIITNNMNAGKENQKTLENKLRGIQLICEYVKDLEQFELSNKKYRNNKYSNLKSKENASEYFTSIIKTTKEKEEKMNNIFALIYKKYNIQINNKAEIDQLVHGYLNQQKVTLSQVKTWLKGKIIVLKTQGAELTKLVKDVCSSWKKDREYIPFLLNTIVEDRTQTPNSFLMSLAYYYEYQVLIQEKAEWQQQIASIYLELQSLLII